MKKNILIAIFMVSLFFTKTYAQVNVFGTDENGNQTQKCSNEGWDKSDCSLTKIKVGEVIPDKKEVDCDGISKTIYGTLQDGKPIMIIVEAWGCGPCWDGAGEKAEYIQKHKNKINFWIAISEYFGNDAICSNPGNKFDQRSIAGWENTHPGLKDAFFFLDNNRTYNLVGIPAQPGVGVIDPKTKKLVFSGYDFTAAKALAEKLAENITSANSASIFNFNFFPNPTKDKLNIESDIYDNQLEIISLDGITVMNTFFKSNKETIDISNLKQGIYIIKINNKAKQLVIE